MRTKTKEVVTAALIAALICVATMVIKIPSPLEGYLNLGDGIVLISAWILSPGYGFLAAGIGSALADLLSGYVIYAPATFIIKGLMAITAFLIFGLLHKKLGDFVSKLISAIAAEAVMVLGYFVFEGFLYGFIPSLVNIIPNAMQGVAGIIIGLLIINLFKKIRFKRD